jgi:hypothetical protein
MMDIAYNGGEERRQQVDLRQRLLDARDERGRPDAECVSELEDRRETWLADPTLDLADERSIHIGLKRKRLLRQRACLPLFSQNSTEGS